MIRSKNQIFQIGIQIVLVASVCFFFQGCKQQRIDRSEGSNHYQLTDLRILEKAFQSHQNNLSVTQQGKITRILADDLAGDRHQRCIVELASGQMLLIAHNIDVAPRVPGLTTGTPLIFHGVYEWNAQGGVIHWTHHDPDGHHEAGWLIYQGKTYQ